MEIVLSIQFIDSHSLSYPFLYIGFTSKARKPILCPNSEIFVVVLISIDLEYFVFNIIFGNSSLYRTMMDSIRFWTICFSQSFHNFCRIILGTDALIGLLWESHTKQKLVLILPMLIVGLELSFFYIILHNILLLLMSATTLSLWSLLSCCQSTVNIFPSRSLIRISELNSRL